MHIPLLAGRLLTDHDAEPGRPDVVLVNQSFATKYFPRGDALGKYLVSGETKAEIVGIVADVRGTGGHLDGAVQPEIDQPEHGGWPDMQFVLRTTQPPSALEPAMKQRLAVIDSGLALGPVSQLEGSLDEALLLPRLNTGLLTGLAGLALVLALIGVYGVTAFSVSQRTREIGVRIALGSTREAVLRLILRESMAVLTGGVLLGIAGAIFANRLLTATISGLSGSIGLPLLMVSTLFVVAVLGASLVPARRATLIEPVEALRTE
jgi:putative ABC transport system permease protein